MNEELGHRIIALRERIVSNFTYPDWEELGFLTGTTDIISGHPRLLRSLHWGDEDYDGNVLNVIGTIAQKDPALLDRFVAEVDRKYPTESHFVSAKPRDRKLTFAPHVFELPNVSIDEKLVAVMMPFDQSFNGVCEAIKLAAESSGLSCLRADDIWEETTIIQDIFNLILRARIVVVDFTERNPNVMYETGIAHTLGKLVVPISQNLSDVPFDVSHHRVLHYLNNSEGLSALESKLTKKLAQRST